MTMGEAGPGYDTKIRITKILVPIDGSECSLNAAKYATRITRHEKAKLFCIHDIGSVPYGYTNPAPATDQYYNDVKGKADSWFYKVRQMAKIEGIAEVETETFMDVKSLIGSTIDYATCKSIDLIVLGRRREELD